MIVFKKNLKKNFKFALDKVKIRVIIKLTKGKKYNQIFPRYSFHSGARNAPRGKVQSLLGYQR